MISITCQECGACLSTADAHAGKKCQCPVCKTMIPIPGQSPTPKPSTNGTTTPCPHCSASLAIPGEWHGKQVSCSGCKKPFVVPEKHPQPQPATTTPHLQPPAAAEPAKPRQNPPPKARNPKRRRRRRQKSLIVTLPGDLAAVLEEHVATMQPRTDISAVITMLVQWHLTEIEVWPPKKQEQDVASVE